MLTKIVSILFSIFLLSVYVSYSQSIRHFIILVDRLEINDKGPVPPHPLDTINNHIKKCLSIIANNESISLLRRKDSILFSFHINGVTSDKNKNNNYFNYSTFLKDIYNELAKPIDYRSYLSDFISNALSLHRNDNDDKFVFLFTQSLDGRDTLLIKSEIINLRDIVAADKLLKCFLIFKTVGYHNFDTYSSTGYVSLNTPKDRFSLYSELLATNNSDIFHWPMFYTIGARSGYRYPHSLNSTMYSDSRFNMRLDYYLLRENKYSTEYNCESINRVLRGRIYSDSLELESLKNDNNVKDELITQSNLQRENIDRELTRVRLENANLRKLNHLPIIKGNNEVEIRFPSDTIVMRLGNRLDLNVNQQASRYQKGTILELFIDTTRHKKAFFKNSGTKYLTLSLDTLSFNSIIDARGETLREIDVHVFIRTNGKRSENYYVLSLSNPEYHLPPSQIDNSSFWTRIIDGAVGLIFGLILYFVGSKHTQRKDHKRKLVLAILELELINQEISECEKIMNQHLINATDESKLMSTEILTSNSWTTDQNSFSPDTSFEIHSVLKKTGKPSDRLSTLIDSLIKFYRRISPNFNQSIEEAKIQFNGKHYSWRKIVKDAVLKYHPELETVMGQLNSVIEIMKKAQ